jgi:hypothetical protein
MMKIAVCGWYFRSDFYQMLKHINDEFPVTIISNKIIEGIDVQCFNETRFILSERENIGLEFGAYDYYIKNLWDGESDVLFIQDDVRLLPVMRDYETAPPNVIFRGISKIRSDQAYIFNNDTFAVKNNHIHGRAFFCSARLIKWLLEHNNGIWYDKNNTGHTRGPTPGHCLHYNYANYQFSEDLKKAGYNFKTGGYIIVPALECAVRGRFDNEIYGPPPQPKEESHGIRNIEKDNAVGSESGPSEQRESSSSM